MGNLPSFVGVRNICFQPVNNETFSPNLVIQMDNIQAAVFVVRCWCKRTGQMPHEFSVAVNNGKKGVEVIAEEMHRSSPLYIELLWERYKCKLVRLDFGAAASLAPQNESYEKDVIPVQGVRCSQSFGVQKNVYTTRKLKQLYEEKAEGTLERIRRKSRTAAAIEYERAKKELKYSHATRSEYGAKEIFGVGTRYARARDKYAIANRDMKDTELQTLLTEGVPFGSVMRGQTLTESDFIAARKLGVELPEGIITEDAAECLVDFWRRVVDEKRAEGRKLADRADNTADIESVVVESDTMRLPLNPQRKRRLKEAFVKAVKSEAKSVAAPIVSAVDMDALASTLKEICEVSVEVDGQITLKFN